MPLAAFLTDYGPASEHVGALHSILARDAPGVERIDLAHDLPAGDIRFAALVLERTAGSEKEKILTAIENLQASGSTHLEAGLVLRRR